MNVFFIVIVWLIMISLMVVWAYKAAIDIVNDIENSPDKTIDVISTFDETIS